MSRLTKLKPAGGFARFLHIALNLLLPVIAYTLVAIDFTQLAIFLILLSKWRMFAVKPRHWLPNFRANSVDIIVGVSLVLFMEYSQTSGIQMIWMGVYIAWLLLLKPRSGVLSMAAQAMVAQLFGLLAMYLLFISAPLVVFVALTWLITYCSARHFLSGFEETAMRSMADIWAYFAAALTWLLGHWLLFYGFMPQIVLLLSIISYGLGVLYYLHKTDRLSGGVQKQVILMMCAIILVIVIFSDWSDKTI